MKDTLPSLHQQDKQHFVDTNAKQMLEQLYVQGRQLVPKERTVTSACRNRASRINASYFAVEE
jgi:hypothetical protein